jgi:hypothetical protein
MKIHDRFIKHNQIYFKRNFKIKNSNEILVEFNGWQICHIMNSYLANALSSKFSAKIKAYPGYTVLDTNFFSSIIRKFKWKISNYLRFKNFAIYNSFNVENFFLPSLNYSQKLRNKNLYKLIISKIYKKSDLLNLKIQNILIGDLIYNSYLLDFKEPFNIEDIKFKKYLYKSLGLFIFWKDYLSLRQVKAIIVTHSVYLSAINLRIALSLGIPAYSANDELVYKFDKSNLHPWIDFKNFKKNFSNISKNEKRIGIKKSIKIINSRISGSMKYFFDNYKQSSPFQKENKINSNRIIVKSNKIKILIAAHCFFDSPHIYGKMFFSDFYDWIEYLGKVSLVTDYDWYIKSHKNYFPETRIQLENFCNKYKKFKLLPADISHHTIIKEGIDLALTCYGTIGWEYPLLGVPVMLSSINHPYVNYNFNLKPKKLNKYDKILKSLNKSFLKKKSKINKAEIYEYYFMNYLYGKNKSWLLKDLNKKKHSQLLQIMRTRNVAYSDKIYQIWLNRFTKTSHYAIMNGLNNFFASNKISSHFI